jgi:molybdopterin molybdotransferase
VLRRLAGAADSEPLAFRVPCETPIKKKIGRREWVRASVRRGADGAPLLRPFPQDGAGILTSLVESDGLIELDEATGDVPAGTPVEFLPFSELIA